MAETATPALKEGLPYPLGATWDGQGTNFALFSANATSRDGGWQDEGYSAKRRR